MKSISTSIIFSKIESHLELVSQLSEVFSLIKDDCVELKIDLSGGKFLYSDFLTLVCSVVVHLREKGVIVNGKFLNFRPNSNAVLYASRVDFFKLLNFGFEEKFKRRDSSGRFLEIKKFNNSNAIELHGEIIKILIESGISDNILVSLQYCLYELIDNTLIHSAEGGAELSKGYGFVSVQYFSQNKEIRLIISDNGFGIHYALTRHPKSQFKHFTESESILNCINKGVTNSNGRGFGLWATTEFVRLNQGELIIHSGEHHLKIDSEITISRAPNWHGTYTFLRINTGVYVDNDMIFENSKDHLLDDLKDKLFGLDGELW